MITYSRLKPNIAHLSMSGEITADDYKQVRPKLEQAMNEVGVLNFLIEVMDVEKFTMGAALQDLKFDFTHWSHVGKTAIIGNKQTHERMANALDILLMSKDVKYFEEENESSAKEWLNNKSNLH